MEGQTRPPVGKFVAKSRRARKLSKPLPAGSAYNAEARARRVVCEWVRFAPALRWNIPAHSGRFRHIPAELGSTRVRGDGTFWNISPARYGTIRNICGRPVSRLNVSTR